MYWLPRKINSFRVLSKMALQVRTLLSPSVQQMLTLQQLEVCGDIPARAVILGVYADPDEKNDSGILTPLAWKYNVQKTNGRLLELLRMMGPMPKVGEYRMIVGSEADKIPYYSTVAVVGLGKECAGYNPYEVLDEQKEYIRRSVGRVIFDLALLDFGRVDVDNCGHAESAAEGAHLGVYLYQELKNPNSRVKAPAIDLFTIGDEPCDIEGWKIGITKSKAQNLARQLQEMPSNLLTPTLFAQNVVEVLCKSGVNVEVKVEGWAESQSMHAFLSVGKASCEQPIFLELSYFGTKAEVPPIVLVGQGVTYDCGGLCLKEVGELIHMRADMTGAAVVVATCRAVASMRLPLNIRGLIPLCENMIGCNSFRPGDIMRAMNGLHMEVEGTNHEDVLVLADAVLYGQNFCPKFIVDVGTTSGYMRDTLDEAACGVFTNSEILWQQIKHASMHTGDRVWRLPLWNYYSNLVRATDRSDISNYGIGRGGRPCKAAAFLRNFVPCGQWMHIDVTSVMRSDGYNFEYLREGMAGRPTRTLIEFLAQQVCKDTAPKLLD